MHERPLHSTKIGVWCALSRQIIIGPIFFSETVNSERYINIIHEFIGHLTEDENQPRMVSARLRDAHERT